MFTIVPMPQRLVFNLSMVLRYVHWFVALTNISLGFVRFSHSQNIISWQQQFQTNVNNVQEMMFQVHLKAMQIDADYEMNGKSLDDD